MYWGWYKLGKNVYKRISYIFFYIVIFFLCSNKLFSQKRDPLLKSDPVTGATFDESKFMEKLLFDREQDKINKGKQFKSWSEWRPRGATVDGRIVVFEMRNTALEPAFAIIVFNTLELTRTFYYFQTKLERDNYLKKLEESLGFGFFEPAIQSYAERGDSKWSSENGYEYTFEIIKDDLKVFRTMIYSTFNGRKRLLANYSFEKALQSKPYCERIYVFNNERGIAFKFSYELIDNLNKVSKIEDVICINEVSYDDKFNVTRESAWLPDREFIELPFLNDHYFDYNYAKIYEIKHTLFGKKSVIHVTNN